MVDDYGELRVLPQAAAIEAGATDMARCVDRMEHTFDLYDKGRVAMGGPGQCLHGHMTTFPGDLAEPEATSLRPGSRFGAMPAYVGGDVDRIGVKWYGAVTAAPGEPNAPASTSLFVLSDPDTGRPEALLDGSILTTVRTGAMAGLGARSIQGERAETATILGPGAVGQASALALDAVLDSLSEIRFYHPNLTKAAAVPEEMDDQINSTLAATDSVRDAVADADVVVVAASRNPSPRIDTGWLSADTTVIQLGDLRVDLDGFDTERIFCDVRTHPLEFERQVGWDITRTYSESVGSEGWLALDDVRTLHELVAGSDDGDTRGLSFLSSLGLPMEDVTWGTEIYRKAVSMDLGQTLKLRSEPHFSNPV